MHMRCTCVTVPSMSKMIQVRNVPDSLHRELLGRSRARGVTLTRYIQDLLEKEVSRPPATEIVERIAVRPGVALRQTAAEILREERERGAAG